MVFIRGISGVEAFFRLVYADVDQYVNLKDQYAGNVLEWCSLLWGGGGGVKQRSVYMPQRSDGNEEPVFSFKISNRSVYTLLDEEM